MAVSSHIVRFPCSDAVGGFFVIEARPSGSKPLDLLLRGTNGQVAFETKTRHNRVKEFKSSNAQCSEAEWEQILISTLTDDGASADGIETKVDCRSDDEATLHFRKNIQGITQRLGSITLKEHEESEISPFDWCVSILGDRERISKDVSTMQFRTRELEGSVDELKTQLEDLIQAKHKDETALLEKFRDLLNEKKVKIRQQQRLLASAEVDPDKLVNTGASQTTVRKAKASRSSKRKIKSESPEESEDGFDMMEVDDNQGQTLHSETDQEQTTTDDETQSDPEEAGASEPEPEPATSSKATRTTKAASRKAEVTDARHSAQPAETNQEEPKTPPRRVLPFKARVKKPASASAPAPTPAPAPAQPAGDETESDDEL